MYIFQHHDLRVDGASRHSCKVERWRSHTRTLLNGPSLRDELCVLDSVPLGLGMDDDVVKRRRPSIWLLDLGYYTGKEGKGGTASGSAGVIRGVYQGRTECADGASAAAACHAVCGVRRREGREEVFCGVSRHQDGEKKNVL